MKLDIRQNLGLKIISILAAVLIWFLVAYSANPPKTQNFYVELKLQNYKGFLDRGLRITEPDFKKTITISVKALKEVLAGTSSNDFEVNTDLSEIKSSGKLKLAVIPPLYRGKEQIIIEDFSPKFINVQVEKNVLKSYDVRIETTGKPKESYQVTGISSVPDSISIEALDSVLNNIGAVKAIVDIKDIDRERIVKKVCKVYDKAGQEMQLLNQDLKVDVRIEVARELPLQAVITGTPAEKHLMVSNSIFPETVLVTGNYNKLSVLERLFAQPVSINRASGNIRKKVAIIVPDGIKLVNSPSEAETLVLIEKIEEIVIEFGSNEIGILNARSDNKLKYNLISGSYKITLAGLKRNLDRIDRNELKPRIDVDNMAEGVHSLPLILDLPDGVALTKVHNVEIKVSENLSDKNGTGSTGSTGGTGSTGNNDSSSGTGVTGSTVEKDTLGKTDNKEGSGGITG